MHHVSSQKAQATFIACALEDALDKSASVSTGKLRTDNSMYVASLLDYRSKLSELEDLLRISIAGLLIHFRDVLERTNKSASIHKDSTQHRHALTVMNGKATSGSPLLCLGAVDIMVRMGLLVSQRGVTTRVSIAEPESFK